MAVNWNGEYLVNEFSALLGDENTSFKSKVLQWINDVQEEICAEFDWPFLQFEGETVLTADQYEQTLTADYDIRKLTTSPYIKTDSKRYLKRVTLDQIKFLTDNSDSSGVPEYFDNISYNKLFLYPRPSDTYTIAFYYTREPSEITNSALSVPILPYWLKKVLKAGVLAMGYEYRDRDGQETKMSNYYEMLKSAINTYGIDAKQNAKVSDRMGSSTRYFLA